MTHVRIDGQYVRRRKRNDPSSPVALTCSPDRPEEGRVDDQLITFKLGDRRTEVILLPLPPLQCNSSSLLSHFCHVPQHFPSPLPYRPSTQSAPQKRLCICIRSIWQASRHQRKSRQNYLQQAHNRPRRASTNRARTPEIIFPTAVQRSTSAQTTRQQLLRRLQSRGVWKIEFRLHYLRTDQRIQRRSFQPTFWSHNSRLPRRSSTSTTQDLLILQTKARP